MSWKLKKKAQELAEKEGVDVRLYRVIYDAIDDIKAALSGMLKPEQRERHLGTAEVRAMFRVPKLGVIAGCYVTQGTITRDGRARLVRDSVTQLMLLVFGVALGMHFAGRVPALGRVRLVRDSVVVYDGKVASLRRFKDDVREVAAGYECGIGIENFQDIKEGDLIEAYEVREVARTI